MNYISVCSGIEAASVAWHRIPNWTPVAFAEIEKFPSAVLAHHFPQVPNLGDMTKFHEWPDFSTTPIQLLVGGCPCQAFSVAGLREGLNDPRGNLTLTFLGVAAKYKPKWIVYENVPGILSDKTDAFGCLIAGLVELGYGVAWRFHDAQFTGLAQRRKRVFVVACLGDWTSASEVLFEPDCLRWNPPPSREARQEVAGTLSARTEGGGGLGTDFDLGGGLVSHSLRAQAQSAHDTTMETYVASIAPTLNAHFGDKQGLENQHIDGGAGYLSRAIAGSLCSRDNKSARMDADTNHLVPMRQGGFFDGPTHSLRAEGFDASEDGTGRGTPIVAIPILEAGARTGKSTTDIRAGSGIGDDGDPMFTLQRGKQHAVACFDCMNQDVSDVSHTLRRGGGAGHESIPVAFNWNAQVDQMNFDPNTTPSLTCSQGAAIGPVAFQTLTHKGFDDGVAEYASTQEANATETLSILRDEIGAEAASEWLSGILDTLQQEEVLRPGLYGKGVRRKTDEGGCGVDDGALSREKGDPEVRLPEVRRKGREGCSPQGRELSQQLAGKLDSLVQKLSHERAQSSRYVQNLRKAGEGLGLLQPALSPIQGRSACLAVRRLTPIECERLMGFPDHWTNIPWRGKAVSPDGPRYKALGNSMAVPCMRWIGERIAMVDAKPRFLDLED